MIPLATPLENVILKQKTGSGSLRDATSAIFVLLGRDFRADRHRLYEGDHDELGRRDGCDPDIADEQAIIYLFRGIGLGIAFYEEGLLGIPSGQHP